MSETEIATTGESSAAALIIFGRDTDNKPHASRFDEASSTLALKAASLMGYSAVAVPADSDFAQLAAKLPAGKVFASGRAFVPFVRAQLFDDITKHGNDHGLVELPAVTEKAEAAGDDEGNIGDTKPDVTAAHSIPGQWSDIVTGSLVLASEGAMDGWYESIVIEARAEDLFILKWRDWPELPQFVRRRADLALLNTDMSGAVS